MVYGTYNYSFHGVYKPTNITGGHHPIGSMVLLYMVCHGYHQYTPIKCWHIYQHHGSYGIWPLTIWQFSQSNMICNMFQPLSKCHSILHFRCRCVFVLILLHGICPLKCCHCSNSIVDHYTTIGWKLNCVYAPVTLKVSISVLLD